MLSKQDAKRSGIPTSLLLFLEFLYWYRSIARSAVQVCRLNSWQQTGSWLDFTTAKQFMKPISYELVGDIHPQSTEQRQQRETRRKGFFLQISFILYHNHNRYTSTARLTFGSPLHIIYFYFIICWKPSIISLTPFLPVKKFKKNFDLNFVTMVFNRK